jgi:hypothetical protein
VIVTGGPTATPDGTTTSSDAAPTRMVPPNPAPTNDSGRGTWSIVPDTWLEMLAIPLIMAGLIVAIGAAIVAVVLTRWWGDGTDDPAARSRYLVLALALWVGLSLFLVLDLGFGLAVSVYPGFVAAYAAFWVLVGALLLYRRPTREKVITLLLFVVVLCSVRFVDWNSRKPFLRDFQRIREGMTRVEVERIMGRYTVGDGRPIGSPTAAVDAQGNILTGTVTYRHTDEGWGDSDWGVVTFESGRVVETQFMPD